MGKIKFGRAFGLSILSALSLMAVFAVSAQAVEFQIASKPALLAMATGTQEGAGHLIVEGRKLDLECQKGDVSAGSEIINSKEGLATITFLECKAYKFEGGVKGTELPCTVANPVATGVILPAESGGVKYVLAEGHPFKDEDGKELVKLFTTVFLSGALCTLPEENPIKGTLAAQVTTNGEVVNLITTNKTIQGVLSDKLFFGTFESYVEAKSKVELTGAHKELKFGVA